MEELRTLIGRLHAVPLDRSPSAVGVPFHRGARRRLVRRLHQGSSQHDGRTCGHGDARGHIRLCVRRGADVPAHQDRPSGRGAVRRHRTHQHRCRRFRPPRVARGKVVAGRREGARQGCAELRARRAVSLHLRQGHAEDAVQQDDLRPPRLCNRVASLCEVKALAKSQGATINDVVLALCAGGLRRYLAEHDALPKKPLAIGVPVSMRPPGNEQLNNQVFFTLSRLPTDVADPLPRLAAARTAGSEAKNLFADMRDLITTDVALPGAPLVAVGLTRLWAAARADELRLAVIQYRDLERAGTQTDHVLPRRAGYALFPRLDPLSRLRSEHHRKDSSSILASSPVAKPYPTRSASPTFWSRTSRPCMLPHGQVGSATRLGSRSQCSLPSAQL